MGLIDVGRKNGCTVQSTSKPAVIYGHWHQPYVRKRWWHILRRLRQFHFRQYSTQPEWWPKERQR